MHVFKINMYIYTSKQLKQNKMNTEFLQMTFKASAKEQVLAAIMNEFEYDVFRKGKRIVKAIKETGKSVVITLNFDAQDYGTQDRIKNAIDKHFQTL